MNKQLLERAAEMARRGESFVLAMVVRREPYSSSQQGDMAIIAADGSYHGWLGGNCTRPAVQREAASALLDGKPRLISLSPEPELPARAGVTPLAMTCHSGGTVEIFLEPVLAAPRLVVFGVSPVARAVAQLGKAMGYLVDLVDPSGEFPRPAGRAVGDPTLRDSPSLVDPEAHAAELPHADRVFPDLAAPELRVGPPVAYAVVASMGECDEDAVAAALTMRPAYLGVVASHKRFAILRQTLLDRGISAHALDAIKSPAGLDLGGRQPEEVALSILAEIVQCKHAAVAQAQAPSAHAGGPTRGAAGLAPVVAGPAAVAASMAVSAMVNAPAGHMDSPGHVTSDRHAGGAAPGGHTGPTDHTGHATPRGRSLPVALTAIDPVCHMTVTVATARHVGTWDGRTWYFCNPRCKDRFLADPQHYLEAPSTGVAR